MDESPRGERAGIVGFEAQGFVAVGQCGFELVQQRPGEASIAVGQRTPRVECRGLVEVENGAVILAESRRVVPRLLKASASSALIASAAPKSAMARIWSPLSS